MAKFRKNHGQPRKGNSFVIRGIIVTVFFVIVILSGFSMLNRWMKDDDSLSNSSDKVEETLIEGHERDYLPSGSNSQVIHHRYYSLSYNEKYELADWVAYHLTKASLRIPNVKRAKKYRPDYKIKSRSAIHSDYTHSGYTRGHLVPAGDMAFSKEAMEESFMMSNMTPQIREFNNGIWKELEENVRDWAFYYEDLYIVSGPVFYKNNPKKIGKNEVAVPDAFYKVILDNKSPYQKAIAYIIPNEKSDRRLEKFSCPIDKVEALTSLNFFDALLDDELEDSIESRVDNSQWEIDEKRYQLRINKWNKQN